MASDRPRRNITAPRRFCDEEEGYVLAQGREGAGWRKVYHLLGDEDLSLDLRGRPVFVLWPADGLWYEARVERVPKKERAVRIVYVGTEEEEDADLGELVRAKQLAVVELRPPGVGMGDRDVPDGQLALASRTTPGGDGGIAEAGSEGGDGEVGQVVCALDGQTGKRGRAAELDAMNPDDPTSREAKKARQDGMGGLGMLGPMGVGGGIEMCQAGMVKEDINMDDQVQEAAAMEDFSRNLLASIVGRQPGAEGTAGGMAFTRTSF